MKLALVRQRYNPFGGAERFVERAFSTLADKSSNNANIAQVTLITREWQGAADASRNIRICNPFYLGRLWRDSSFAKGVQHIMASGEFDLVQSHERIPGCSIYRAGDGVHATWLTLRGQIQTPLQRLASKLHPWHRYTLSAEKALFQHADLRAVICNSHMVKADIASRFGVADSRLHVIHNGVDLDHFHPGLQAQHRTAMRAKLGIADNVPVILFVGSGFERKGVAPLLRAMPQLAHNDAQLIIVGTDRKLKAMQALAEKLGLRQRIHFVGGQTDVRPWYAMADVFALPTLYDPFPNAVLEALACGLPVLTSTTSGAAEVLKNPQCGAVCAALDIPGIATALDRLITLRAEQTERVTQASRNTVLPLGRAHMANQLLALYQRVLHG